MQPGPLTSPHSWNLLVHRYIDGQRENGQPGIDARDDP